MVGRGITPLWRHRQREQFARAVDAHLGDERPDEARDEDEAFADELAVVALLRKAAVTAGPDEETRARMRERVLGASPPPPTGVDVVRPHRAGARGRLAVALVAALCLVFSLAGMSLLLSRDALPGDALYGVKRTAESASLGLTFGEEPKGYKRLEFAAARLDEMETLVDRYRESGGGPLGAYLTALADFDADAAAGSRVLTALGADSDQGALDGLRDWASTQSGRLAGLLGSLPAGAAPRADESRGLLDRIAERAVALRARTGCAAVASGEVDQVGPLPARDDCAAPPAPTGTTAPTTVAPTAPPGSAAVVLPTAPDGEPDGEPGRTSPDQPGTATPTPGATPTAPLPLPLPPVTTTPGPLLPLPTLTIPSLPLPLPLPGLGG
ncbi:hypothetical protein CKY47_01615 [Saccharothrix yanglingensis]|uniref:DUF5667 domain-containing protein n=1 Tax=Saccharothrix yanglingensis TaxID=659496 RepID=A0ABU0WUA4_9PSEU|nr:hypothetical protein [Saccharothrix yanglingensis]